MANYINHKDLGAKEKYFRRVEGFSFRDFGRSMHYFQGSREHKPTWGPQELFSSTNRVDERR